jgi:hypothetical protein
VADTLTILAIAAASSSLVKIVADSITTWIKRNRSRNIELQKSDGTRVLINFDPSQEESVRTFLAEIGKETSTKDGPTASGGDGG